MWVGTKYFFMFQKFWMAMSNVDETDGVTGDSFTFHNFQQ